MDFMAGMVGPVVTVNGLVEPVLPARPGQVQRWRVVNASTSRFYRLRLEGHALRVVGSDGGLLDKPYRVEDLLLTPGERVDLLIKASSAPGTYRLATLPYSRGSMMGGMMGGGMMGGGMMGGTLPAASLLALRVEGQPRRDALPSVVDPMARRAHPDLSRAVRRRFVLGMGMGRASINGRDFDVSPLVVSSRLSGSGPTWEVWTIANPTGMDHPWHQHTNHAQVLSVSGGDAGYRALYTTAPAWKDTVLVPRGGSITQLVRVADWRGEAMFHCHIVEHEDIGMLGVWSIT
jgi:FtsP/CotA-like multicopper oxidase with cupredoxin domain